MTGAAKLGPVGSWSRASWGAIAFLAGCGEEAVRVDLVVDSRYRSALIGVEYEGARTVTAADIAGGIVPLIPPVHHNDGTVRLSALLYERPLSDLGPAPGIVEPDPAGRALPTPDAVRVRLVQGADGGTWQDEALPESLTTFRTQMVIARCPQLQVVANRGLGTRLGVGAVIADGDGVLAFLSSSDPIGAAEAPQLLRIDASGHQRLDPSIPRFHDDFAGLAIFAAARGEDGRIWLATSASGDVSLWVGDLRSAFRSPAPMVHPAYWIRSLVVRGGPDARVYALDDRGAVLRFDERDATWTTLYEDRFAERACSAHPRIFCGGLAWWNDALYRFDPRGRPEVVRFDETTTTTTAVRLPIDASVLGVLPTSDGLYVTLQGEEGSFLGHLGVAGWTLTALGDVAYALGEWPGTDGLVLAGVAGAQARRRGDDCAWQAGLTGFNPAYVVPLGDVLFFGPGIDKLPDARGERAYVLVREQR